jgi:heme exporter protein C
MWWKILIFLVMAGVIVAGFVTPAPQQQIGEASRVFYFHIPQAWLCVVAFGLSMVFSIRYLIKKNLAEDDKALVAASLGFVFCALATVTGSMFAKVTWGSFWNWDPRETSIVILLLIYGAYFALRNAVEVEEKKATLAAVYSIFAFVTVPFLIFVVPRIMPSLHPENSILDENMKFQMTAPVASIFFTSLAVFSALFGWIFDLGRRVARLKRRQETQEL